MPLPVATSKFIFMNKIVTIDMTVCESTLCKISVVNYNSCKQNGWYVCLRHAIDLHPIDRFMKYKAKIYSSFRNKCVTSFSWKAFRIVELHLST